MRIGYIRVSTEEQHTIRQDNLMERLKVERIYIDKCTGKDSERPELQKMLSFIREGDIVIVSELDRLARNTKDLLELVELFESKGVKFESQYEKIDTSTPTGEFMLTVFAAVAQLERKYILARQREGIEARKAAGGYNGRPFIKIDKGKFEDTYNRWKDKKITAVYAAKSLNISPQTFYRRVKEYEKDK